MYQAAENRYGSMEYKRSGRSGVLLPRISLGLWQNFGLEKSLEEQEAVLFRAFDMGITHFDLANNYGFPAVGKAEENFGSALRDGLGRYRDELFISTKAGFDFWPGPYGNWGSRKYLMASLDSSLKRMGLEYVDVFYHHRPDPETPLEETMGALSDMVRQGKALYVGISNYQAEEAQAAIRILRENKTPCLLHQPRYNMFERWAEDGLFELLDREGVGCICYSPLAQGALSEWDTGRIQGFKGRDHCGRQISDRGQAGKNQGSEQNGRGARTVPGPDGPGLGTSQEGSHQRSHRGQQYCPAGG